MSRKWPCPLCGLEFSRRWNMERHIDLRHKVQLSEVKTFGIHHKDYNPVILRNNSAIAHDAPRDSMRVSNDPIFKGLSETNDMTKSLTEFGKVCRELSNNRIKTENVDYLKQQVNFHVRQLSDIYSNFWLVPKYEIRGVSGYFCEKCQSFSSHFIRNEGYDMTAEARHQCNWIKSGQTDNFWEQTLLNSVNFYLPNMKYLLGRDLTQPFNQIRINFNSDIANRMFGIPERYRLYSLQNSVKLDWLDRVLANLGKKVMIKEFEMMDFLRRVKSTYAIFEIPMGESVKMISISLVG
jgi:hypothetical protein